MEKQQYGKGLYVQLLKSYSEYFKESGIELNEDLNSLRIDGRRLIHNLKYLAETLKKMLEFIEEINKDNRKI